MSSKSHFFRSRSRLNHSNAISQWKFDNNMIDSIGTNDGTYFGDNNYTIAPVYYALNLEHNSSYATIPNSLDLAFTNGTNDIKKTITMLFLFDTSISYPLHKFILCKRGDTGFNDKEWQLMHYDGVLSFVIFDDFTGARLSIDYPFVPTINQFYSFGIGSDGQGGFWLSVDGVKVGSTTIVGTYERIYNYNNPLFIGSASWDTPLFPSHGDLGPITIWNIDMTDSEILELATKELNGEIVI